jgi:hypothetical protein
MAQPAAVAMKATLARFPLQAKTVQLPKGGVEPVMDAIDWRECSWRLT